MRTRIDADNPFGWDRYGFAWQHVRASGAAHLDFGCGDGRFLRALRNKRIKCLIGVDVGREAIRYAERASGGIEIIHIDQVAPLPFPDAFFSSITLLDVLEHVDEQGVLLDELYRVLRDDGVLIVTVPRRHVLSCLDLGNLKFRFPRLHRWYYLRRHSSEAYRNRYTANPDGLVGDVSASKGWHEHFSPAGLAALLARSRFATSAFDGTGFFTRLLKIAALLGNRLGPLGGGIRKIAAWDARRFAAANLFCTAQKCPTLWPEGQEETLEYHDTASHNFAATDPQHALQRLGADE